MNLKSLPFILVVGLFTACNGSDSSGSSSTGSGGSTSSSSSTSSSTGGSGSTSGSCTPPSGSTGGEVPACDDDGGLSGPCGSSGLQISSFSVAEDPNSVLAAQATVSTVGAGTLQIRFAAEGGPVETTPGWGVLPGCAVTLPVLGLEAQTTYDVQAEMVASDGRVARSAVVTFTTGPLPSNVSDFTVTVPDGGGTFQDGYVMVAKLYLGAKDARPAEIVDRAGHVKWYVETSPAPSGDMKKNPDGSYLIMEGAPPPYSPSYPGLPVHVDSLGNVLGTLQAPGAASGTDQHEAEILPNGDALVEGFGEHYMDLSSYGGSSHAFVVENSFFRLAPNGRTLLRWDAFDHTSLDDVDPSISLKAASVDATHVNAVSEAPDGNYIVSIRHMSMVLKVDSTTGEVIWRLGGIRSDHTPVRSDFQIKNDPWGGFSFQHHVRQLPNGHILMLDNGNGHKPPQSRAVEYALDENTHTATLVWQYVPEPAAFALAMGSAQRLPNGNTLVTFGTLSRVDEVDREGHLVWSLTDPTPGFGFYRAFYIDTLY